MSCVSSHILVFSQPTTSRPPANHSVLLASSANIRCSVPKQVSMNSHFPVLGSYTLACRGLLSRGNILAEGLSPPFLQKAGSFSGARTEAADHTRPFVSIIKLCTLPLL